MNTTKVFLINGNMVTVWTFLQRSPSDTRASFSIIPIPEDINELLFAFAIKLRLRSKSSRVDSHNFDTIPGGSIVENVATDLLNAQEVYSHGATDHEMQMADDNDHGDGDDDD